jgi:hypothetical protein
MPAFNLASTGASVELVTHGASNSASIWLLSIEWFSILATALAVLNSIILVGQHAVANKHPLLQKYTLRILLMVPVYSLVSCLSLWLHGNERVLHLCDVIRMLMESLAIFSFLQYILVAVGGAKVLAAKFDGPAVPQASPPEDEDVERGSRNMPTPVISNPKREVKHFPGLDCFLPRWKSARRMIRWCVRGTLSYVVVGFTIAIIKLICLLITVANGEKGTDGTTGHGWNSLGHVLFVTGEWLITIAQCVALTALATLAVNMMEDLKHIRPEAKFLSVKMVVFFTFWQGLLLQFLARQGCLRALVDLEHNWWDQKTVATGFQNLLTCIEMLIVSIAHFWIWPSYDYLTILAHLHVEPESLEIMPEEISRPRPTQMPKRDVVTSLANFSDIIVTLQGVGNTEFKRDRAISSNSCGAVCNSSECEGNCPELSESGASVEGSAASADAAAAASAPTSVTRISL